MDKKQSTKMLSSHIHSNNSGNANLGVVPLMTLKLNRSQRVSMKAGDLRKLVFWAHVGTAYTYSGSHAKTIPKIIVKQMMKLGMRPNDFCCFINPCPRKLANDVLEEYRVVMTSRGNQQ